MTERTIGISALRDEHDTEPVFMETTVSELYKRLEMAKVDTSITQSEYLRLTSVPENATEEQAAEIRRRGRDAQTRHKAIAGGYMLGRYVNDSRKSPAAAEYRSALAIDCDTLPEQPDGSSWIWDTIDDLLQSNLNCSYMITETRKSTKKLPRLRIIIPLARDCTPEEYQALIHAIGGFVLSPEWIDKTCDEPTRLMFWPTVSAGQSYRHQGGLMRPDLPLLDVDRTLDNLYPDGWHDQSKWPALGPDVGKEVAGHRHRWTTAERAGQKTLQADPRTKPGLIGAFCRLYPIPAAIENFLSGGDANECYKKLTGKNKYPLCYEPARNGRYTYMGEDTTTSGGAVVYDDNRYLYSHHATDPYGGELMNSWNLLQRHMFGYMDDAVPEDVRDNQLPSFKAMKEFAKSVNGVTVEMKADNLARMESGEYLTDKEWKQLCEGLDDFADEDEPAPEDDPDDQAEARQPDDPDGTDNPAAAAGQAAPDPEDSSPGAGAPAERPAWISKLYGMLEWTHDQYGNPQKIKSTVDNYLLIFQHDENLKGKIRYNEFSCRIEARSLPQIYHNGSKTITVFESDEIRNIRDADDAGIKLYIEKNYQLSSKDKFVDARLLTAYRNSYHPVQEYLESLPAWDGVPRAETLLRDYLGAADTAVNREVMPKHLLAAVTRVYHPGTKYDTMIILHGRQGLGKDTFVKHLFGAEFFNDNVSLDDRNSDAGLQTQGNWCIDFPEMDGMKRSDITKIKSFITRQDDNFRSPYGHNVESHPRQSVLFGTTNDLKFLRDLTGARRFACVDCQTQAEKDAGVNCPRYSAFTDLPKQRNQIWAEVMEIYRKDEELYWKGSGLLYSKETADALAGIAEEHRDDDPREKLILDYCLKPIPANWKTWNEEERQGYYLGKSKWQPDYTPDKAIPLVPRQYVCTLGIWVELLGGKRSNFPATERNMIQDILNRENWLKPVQYRDDRYGRPRGWEIISRPKDGKGDGE